MATTSLTASDAPLTWSQRYIWLGHHGLPVGSRHEFNIVMPYTPRQGASVESLTAALEQLSSRHQSLRTTFPADGPYGASQKVRPPGPPEVVVYETERPGTAKAVAAFARADFDLERDPPMRSCLVTTGGRPRRLLVVVHHIAVDDWSLGLLTREDIGLQQFLEAREILGVPAARLAAERRTDAQVAALRASLAESNAELGLAHQFEGHLRFHTIMVQAAHKPLLEVMVRPIFGVLRTRFLRDREYRVALGPSPTLVDAHGRPLEPPGASEVVLYFPGQPDYLRFAAGEGPTAAAWRSSSAIPAPWTDASRRIAAPISSLTVSTTMSTSL